MRKEWLPGFPRHAREQRMVQADRTAAWRLRSKRPTSEPDIEIETLLDLEAALQWMDLLGLYFVADRPTRPLHDGEGFRLQDTVPGE